MTATQPLSLVDSHCHLNLLNDPHPFQIAHAKSAVEQAKLCGVHRFLCVCVDLVRYQEILSIARAIDNVDLSVGVHPNESLQAAPITVETLMQYAQQAGDKLVAVGETGLDYFRTEATQRHAQQSRFRTHIRAAIALKKPLIIHTRHAPEDTLRILREESAQTVGGVMHCFTEDKTVAKQAMDLGFYISFSGIVTFKNAQQVQASAQYVPLSHLLIETDSPYLAPVPYRGKPNVPAYVREVATYLATLKNTPLATLAATSTQNYHRFIASPSP